MAGDAFDRVLTFGRIILAAVKGDQKAILANVATFDDDSGNPAGGANEQEMYGIAGHYCRPMAPDAKGHCEAILGAQTDATTVIASRDLRCNARVNPSDGELGIAHYAGGYISLSWDADARGTLIAISATRLDAQLAATESAHAIILDPSSGNASIQILHQLGSGLVFNKNGDGYLSNASGSGRLTVMDNGSVSLQCDQGFKCTGAVVIGDVTSAKPVAFSQELQAAIQTVITGLTTVSTQLQVLGGAGCAGDIAALAANLAQIASTGTAQTLKASPPTP